jgi:hypothetical protein
MEPHGFSVRTLIQCYDALTELATTYRWGEGALQRATDLAIRLHGDQLFILNNFALYQDSEDLEEDNNNNETHFHDHNYITWPDNGSDNQMMTVE